MDLVISSDYVSRLDKFTQKALEDYTGNDFIELNAKLRYGISLNEYQENMVKLIDIAFDNSPKTHQPIVVYRGLIGKQLNLIVNQYLSCSIDKNVVLDYVGVKCCFLHITISPGSSILYLPGLSQYTSENEILLPRFGNFIITTVTQTNNLSVYHLVYVPPTSVII